MGQRLFNLAAAVSLLLCLGCVVAWVGSTYFPVVLRFTKTNWVTSHELLQVVREVRTAHGGWELQFGTADDHYPLSTPQGSLELWQQDHPYPWEIEFRPYVNLSQVSFEPSWTETMEFLPNTLMGLGTRSITANSQDVLVSTETRARLPMWMPVVAFALLPIIGVWRRAARRRRIKRGRCKECNYNLTANTSGVCPECGTPVPSKPEAAA